MREAYPTRGQLIGILGGAAIVGGAAAWLLLGPPWTIAGVVVGALFALVACSTFLALTMTEPATHLQNHEPHRALTEISQGLWSWRYLARIWPSQFRQPLADTLATQAEALRALADALTRQAEWLLDLGQDSAAQTPASEAADICQNQLPRDELPPCAAQTLLLAGRLLAGQARYREATRPLAGGWLLAARRGRHDLIAQAVPAIRATYWADDTALRAAWLTETGGEPPDWIYRLRRLADSALARLISPWPGRRGRTRRR